MENYSFKELIDEANRNDKIEFIGYGNPNAEILIIGKECAIDVERDKRLYQLSIKNNKKQWLKIINETDEFNTDNIPSWFSPCPEEEKFSPLFPFKGQQFIIERKRKDKEGKIISSGKGTSATWYNYQKLIDRINNYTNRTKNNEIDFLNHCFITEFSSVCSPYSRKSSEVTQSIKNRVKYLLNHPFFSSFSIIIVACGHYIRQYEDIIDLQRLFKVEYDKQPIFVGRNWYNLHRGEGKILIHTNQLSMNISNLLLREIADKCSSYRRK